MKFFAVMGHFLPTISKDECAALEGLYLVLPQRGGLPGQVRAADCLVHQVLREDGSLLGARKGVISGGAARFPLLCKGL